MISWLRKIGPPTVDVHSILSSSFLITVRTSAIPVAPRAKASLETLLQCLPLYLVDYRIRALQNSQMSLLLPIAGIHSYTIRSNSLAYSSVLMINLFDGTSGTLSFASNDP
jgi:hypothetical protein